MALEKMPSRNLEEEECRKKGMKKSRNQARGKITGTWYQSSVHAARGSRGTKFSTRQWRRRKIDSPSKEEIALIRINRILVV
ncbi:hypothetical protein H5410_064380, partial [Solanum commersonii]